MKLKDKADIRVAETGFLFFRHRENIRSVIADRSRIRTVKRSHDLEQSGLAGSARADNRDYLTAFNGEINTFQHLQPVK